MTGVSWPKSSKTKRNYLLYLSISLNIVLMIALVTQNADRTATLVHQTYTWNGGHPLDTQTGTCWCQSQYCMCTPSLAVDMVVLSGSDHVWLAKRKDTGQMATIGGFVQVGETGEEAAKRELQEETSYQLTERPKLLGVYGDARRDNRRHTVSLAYLVQLQGHEHLQAADDVKELHRVPLIEVKDHEFFADHKTILLDYVNGGSDFRESPGDFAPDIHRDMCAQK